MLRKRTNERRDGDPHLDLAGIYEPFLPQLPPFMPELGTNTGHSYSWPWDENSVHRPEFESGSLARNTKDGEPSKSKYGRRRAIGRYLYSFETGTQESSKVRGEKGHLPVKLIKKRSGKYHISDSAQRLIENL